MTGVVDTTEQRPDHAGSPTGITRRDVLRRGAMAGVAVAWAVPVVQTLGTGSAAAASSACHCVFRVTVPGPAAPAFYDCFVTQNSCNCWSDCHLGATCPCDSAAGAACAIPLVFTSCIPVSA